MSDSNDRENNTKKSKDKPLSKIPDFSGDATPLIGGNPPDWFTGTDAQIMFILYTGLTLTPSIIAENTEFSRQTISKRLNTLQAAGFVEKVSRGKYKITKEGAFITSGDPDIYENMDGDSSS